MNLKIAIIHDWLVGRRGGEKVLEEILYVIEHNFKPEKLEIFTLVHKKGTQAEIIEKQKINVSFIQSLPFGLKKYRNYLPLFPAAIEYFDLREFNLIISSTHAVAKGIIPPPESLHISYCHTPMRYIWNHFHSYFGHKKGIKKVFYSYITNYLRVWDQISSERVDFFIANSNNVRKRIKRYYNRDSELIYPPVDTDFFNCDNGKGEKDYFLVVSAMVPYKKVDIVIEAFNLLGFPLKIVGGGPEYKKLRKMAKNNIEFLGYVDDLSLKNLYSGARALVFPTEEDFGIVPVEAQACGTPVIAFRKGGAIETVKEEETGVFFNEQTVASISTAIDKFLNKRFNNVLIRENALKFSKENFREKFSLFVEKILKERKIDKS